MYALTYASLNQMDVLQALEESQMSLNATLHGYARSLGVLNSTMSIMEAGHQDDVTTTTIPVRLFKVCIFLCTV